MPRPLVRPEAVSSTDPDHGDWLAHKLWSQFFVNPLPFLLHQYDRCSMASGVECRMPFMDYRLVEFLFSCPLTTRVGAGYTKRILRHSMRGLLPEPIRTNRIKTGFNAPFSTWLKGPLREWVRDCVRSREFIESEYFDGKSIFQSLERADWAPDSLDERQIWPCLHLTWWIRQSRQSNSAG
jgi:asparagine synthase (glutamine-hydrolysing)